MLTSRQQFEQLLLQSSVLLFFFVVEDKHVTIRTELVLDMLSSSSWCIEYGIHICPNVLELLEELLPKWKAIVDYWVVSIFTVYLPPLISVSTIISSTSSVTTISSTSSISAIISSISSSALHIGNLVLIPTLLPWPILPIIASIPIPVNIIIIDLPLLLLIPGNSIIATIGVLAIDDGDIISTDLIITPIEPTRKIIPYIFEAISIAIDLQVDIAELQIKMIMISIDRECNIRVTYVDHVMIT